MSVNFIIIGAQKAATSALQGALRTHPDIYMPKGESPFFEDPDHALRPWIGFGADHPPAARKGIKRPDYLCSPQAIARISRALPAARFIAVLREPVNRAVSAFYYLSARGILPAAPLNAGLKTCLDDFEALRDTRPASVVSYGLYGHHLALWYRHFPRNRFLILSQRMMTEQPRAVLDRCTSHLGVDVLPRQQARLIGRRNAGFYEPRLLKLAHMGSRLRTRPIPGTSRREPGALLPRALGGCLWWIARAIASRRAQNRETLSPEIATRLQKHYDQDLPLLRTTAPADAIYWTN